MDHHYSDVIMSTMASQTTSVSIVWSTVCSGADQRKHQSSASLDFVWGIHRSPVHSPHKGPITRKILPFDDVITDADIGPILTYHGLFTEMPTTYCHQVNDAFLQTPKKCSRRFIHKMEQYIQTYCVIHCFPVWNCPWLENIIVFLQDS